MAEKIDTSFVINTPEGLLKDNDRGCTERIKRLRRLSHSTQPHLDLERAKIETDVYKEYEGSVSVPVLRALVLKEYFSKKTLYLGDDELLVGEKGKDPQCSPTFPELCCHTIEDMHIMNDRKLVNFTVTEDDLKLQEEEIIPYWKNRAVREHLLKAMTQEWRDCYEVGMFTEFMEQRGPGHTAGGKNFYIKGYGDYKKEIEQAIKELDYFNDPEAYDKEQELRAMDICCDAIIILGKRYHDLALEKAAEEKDPVRKGELEQIAANAGNFFSGACSAAAFSTPNSPCTAPARQNAACFSSLPLPCCPIPRSTSQSVLSFTRFWRWRLHCYFFIICFI